MNELQGATISGVLAMQQYSAASWSPVNPAPSIAPSPPPSTVVTLSAKGMAMSTSGDIGPWNPGVIQTPKTGLKQEMSQSHASVNRVAQHYWRNASPAALISDLCR